MLMKHSGLSILSRFHTPESSPPTQHPTVEQNLVFQNPKQCYQTEKGKPVEAGAKGQNNQIKAVRGLLAIAFVHLNGSFKNHNLQEGKSKHKRENLYKSIVSIYTLGFPCSNNSNFICGCDPSSFWKSLHFLVIASHPQSKGPRPACCLLPSP